MNRSVRIRWLCGGEPLAETSYVSLDQAADLIAQGKAEPDIIIQDHNPPVPAEGLSLAEAFEDFVDRHPDLTQYGDVPFERSTIALQQYVEPPTWSGNADINELRRLAGLKPQEARGDQERRGEPGPRVIRLGELEKELASQLGCFISKLVIHHFVQGLIDEHLHANGVWEGDLATLERKRIPSDWWRRDIVVHIRSCEIWERTAQNTEPGLRQWSAVQIVPSDTEAAKGRTEASVPLRTGAPGRPSSMHLIEAELRRRSKEGLTKSTLRAEVEILAEWFNETAHPEAPRPTRKTIENRLRPVYRSLQADPREKMG